MSLSWFVNTNEDVADFRVELTSLTRDQGPRTLLVKDISYNTRYTYIVNIELKTKTLLTDDKVQFLWDTLLSNHAIIRHT